jgi:hypothetical protein
MGTDAIWETESIVTVILGSGQPENVPKKKRLGDVGKSPRRVSPFHQEKLQRLFLII